MPSILMVNQTSRVRYYGPKDLPSLIQFYDKTTGKILLNLVDLLFCVLCLFCQDEMVDIRHVVCTFSFSFLIDVVQ